jgi:hypothetical protein
MLIYDANIIKVYSGIIIYANLNLEENLICIARSLLREVINFFELKNLDLLSYFVF